MRSANRLLLLMPLSLLICGCVEKTGTATVSGRVTFEGKPVAWGSVVAVAENHEEFQATIHPDGTYELNGVPLGTLRVMVRQPPRKTLEKPRRPKKNEARFPLPHRYYNVDESGLAVSVEGDATLYHIYLK